MAGPEFFKGPGTVDATQGGYAARRPIVHARENIIVTAV
jgi:hypothetical protein